MRILYPEVRSIIPRLELNFRYCLAVNESDNSWVPPTRRLLLKSVAPSLLHVDLLNLVLSLSALLPHLLCCSLLVLYD